MKDKLSAFLPSLPGNIDIPAGADGTGESSLRKVRSKLTHDDIHYYSSSLSMRDSNELRDS